MARFQWNRSTSATLSNLVRNYNKTVQRLGQHFIQFEYAALKNVIKTRRDFNMWTNRLKNIKDPAKQKIVTNRHGVEMLQWERDLLRNVSRRANANREKIRKEIQSERNIGFIPSNEELQYSSRTPNPDMTYRRSDLTKIIEGEIRYSNPDIIKSRNRVLQNNILKSLDKWPKLQEIEELRQLIRDTDPRDLRIMQSDPRYDVDISRNYRTLYSHDEDDLVDIAQHLYNRWLNAKQAVEEQRAVLEGRK